MDRGIPTEAVLAEMRDPPREMFYLVGTPRERVKKYEEQWLDLAWRKVRHSVDVKLFSQDGELYVLANREGRRAKERAIRRRRLARLMRKRRAMRRNCPKRDPLLMRVGAAKKGALLLHQLKLTLPQQPPPRVRPTSSHPIPPLKMSCRPRACLG